MTRTKKLRLVAVEPIAVSEQLLGALRFQRAASEILIGMVEGLLEPVSAGDNAHLSAPDAKRTQRRSAPKAKK